MRRTIRAAPGTNRDIAVLAEPELIDALRLAGISRFRSLGASPANRERIDKTLREWLAEQDIGVIILGAAHADLVRHRVEAARQSRRLWPVIVEAPALTGPWTEDLTGHYRQLSRRFLGLEIVLDEDEAST